MKLTKMTREAFVRKVMADVPSTDYTELARALILKEHVASLPATVQVVWNDLKTREYLETTYIGFRFNSITVPSSRHCGRFSWPASASPQLQIWKDAADKQEELISGLFARLNGVANACTTLKALKEALPEFEKYMPEESAPLSRSVPMLANVVADFVKAGWPAKGKKGGAA